MNVKTVADVHMQRNVRIQDKNRTVRINRELTSHASGSNRKPGKYPRCVITNEPSIQAEGTYGIMKNDRWYKRMSEEVFIQSNWKFYSWR